LLERLRQPGEQAAWDRFAGQPELLSPGQVIQVHLPGG
jgi:hypothetical protein